MQNSMTTRLEIDVQHSSSQRELIDIGTFAVKNRCPAIISPPDLIAPLIADRSVKNGRYSIVAFIDVPDGKKFALDKWRDIGRDPLAADGFEVMLSRNRTPAEYRNEIRTITEFVRGQVNPLAEMRFILQVDDRTDEELSEISKGFASFPPFLVRTDFRLMIQGMTTERHKDQVGRIRKSVAVQVKVSGGVSAIMATELAQLPGVKRLAVSLQQAQDILRGGLKIAEDKPAAKAAVKPEPMKAKSRKSSDGLDLEQGPLGRDVQV